MGTFIKYFYCLLLFFILCCVCTARSQNDPYIVVIDAGHGGRDPGAIGAASYEKNINLAVALKLGKLIENNTDAKVIYTRKKDVFVNLSERANIANKAKAHLFISIHTNALKNKQHYGAETYTLGPNSKENMEIAKRENEVIFLEENYEQRYEGFDPKSAESYIIFEMMMNTYLEQSIETATLIQNNFKNNCKRVDRGVRQAGFLVLRHTAMPSVLIELGYITNREEERYLNTERGQNDLAKAIYDAFLKTKNDFEKKRGGKIIVAKETEVTGTSQPATAVANQKGKIYKIQILASKTPLKRNAPELKGLKNVDYYEEDGWYKYTYGATSDYTEIKRIKRGTVDPKFKQSFIITFENGKKIK